MFVGFPVGRWVLRPPAQPSGYRVSTGSDSDRVVPPVFLGKRHIKIAFVPNVRDGLRVGIKLGGEDKGIIPALAV